MRATLLSLFAAGLVFVALRPPSLGYGPGVYRSRRGSAVYFDRAGFASRAVLHHGCPLVASGRAGMFERHGLLRVDEVVPDGARVTILSGDWRGREGWMAAGELTTGRNGKLREYDGTTPVAGGYQP
jgi:hypothetical protein